MNIKITSVLILLTVLFTSCKDQKNDHELPNSEQEEVIREQGHESEIDTTSIDKAKIIEQLQGTWKEIEYPYRIAEFVNSTVKFIEEGTQNTPSFQQYELSGTCPFNTNNIRNLKAGDIILSLPESKRCERLSVSNDTLTLNGFSTNTNDDYNILYLKLKQ